MNLFFLDMINLKAKYLFLGGFIFVIAAVVFSVIGIIRVIIKKAIDVSEKKEQEKIENIINSVGKEASNE